MSVPFSTDATFPTSDGYPLCYRRYPAEGKPRAEVVCIHGIQSHAGWYEHSCRQLAASGFQVLFLDRRGAGRNCHGRGDAPGFRRLIDDIAEFVRPLPAANSHSLPRFLLAISWGGKLAVGLQRRHPGLVDGLVLVCPGLSSRVAPPFLRRLAIVASRFTSPRRLFPLPLDDPHLFTATPRWLEFLRTDPLALRHGTARLLLESVRLDFYVRLAAPAVSVPTLLFLAGHDRIIDNQRTRRLAARFSGPVDVIEYPEAHHTLEFEPEPDQYIADLTAWLNRQVDFALAGRPLQPTSHQGVAATLSSP